MEVAPLPDASKTEPLVGSALIPEVIAQAAPHALSPTDRAASLAQPVVSGLSAAAPPMEEQQQKEEEEEQDGMITEAMLAMQREAEAELGDVTARLDTETLGQKGQKVAPNLIKAMQGSGNADLLAASDGKTQQLDALLAKASQYSAFIRTSQTAALGAFNQHALDQMQQADDGGDGDGAAGEKRKKGGKGSAKKKKSKAEDVAEAAAGFVDAQAKMAAAKEQSSSSAVTWQPQALKHPLKDYQLEGLKWMATLYENGLSGILADEMGLGKTIQIISLMAYLQEKKVKGPFIIAAPLATLPNWIREFKKWLPNMPTMLYHGSKAERADLRAQHFKPMPVEGAAYKMFPVMITSYEVCIIDRRHLEKHKWSYLIVDEGQRVKNRNCRLIRELKCLDTQNRLLLSGTPIQNTLEELWSLLNFVNPQIFDNLEIFQSWFGFSNIGGAAGTTSSEIVAEEANQKVVTKLHEILRPFLLRRLKKDVLADMPPKKEVVVYTPMSSLQRDYYTMAYEGTLREKLLGMGLSGGRDCSQININMNLRKIANHPFLFGEPNDETGQPICDARPELLVTASGKFKVLDSMLRHLHAGHHQVLIFSQMTETLNIMEDYLRFRQWRYCRIDGSVKVQERQAQMDAFNTDKNIFVFMLSTRAGGLGINLQAADTVILFDSDWNPHQDAQAMDRAHRIGQTQPVAVYRLLTTGSVEIDMMEKQISKKKLERMAISGGNFARPGQRRDGGGSGSAFTVDVLQQLLADDVNLDERAEGAVTDKCAGISEEELAMILDRGRLFGVPCLLPSEGRMYDVVAQAQGGGMLGEMA